MPTYIAPGVYFNETDDTVDIQGTGRTTAAVVIEASKGPTTGITLCTTPSEYIAKFGKPDNTMHHAAYMSQLSALAVLRGGRQLYVKRATNGATYGGAVLVNNLTSGEIDFLALAPLGEDDISDEDFKNDYTDDLIMGIYDYSPTETDIKIVLSHNDETSDGGFWINVYEPSSSTRVTERWLVSLTKRLNGLGDQMFAEDYVNARSTKIVIRVNENFEGTLSDSMVTTDMAAFFESGSAGTPATDEQLIAAYDEFSGDESIRIDLIVNAGWESAILKRNLLDIAYAKNAFALIDVPVSIQNDPDLVVAYRNVTLNDSSYGALLTPNLTVADKYNDTQVSVPPSGYIAGVAAASDEKTAKWYAFSGMEAGDLNIGGKANDVVGVKVAYDTSAQEKFKLSQINPILNFSGYGVKLFGDYTLQTATSMLSFINVRRMMNYVRAESKIVLLFRVFNPRSVALRDKIKIKLEKILDPIAADQGIESYYIICDDSNNTAAHKSAGEIHAFIGIVPIGSARAIVIDATLTKDGVSF